MQDYCQLYYGTIMVGSFALQRLCHLLFLCHGQIGLSRPLPLWGYLEAFDTSDVFLQTAGFWLPWLTALAARLLTSYTGRYLYTQRFGNMLLSQNTD